MTAAVGVVAGRLAVAAVAGTSAVTAVRTVLHCAADSATVLWDLCDWRTASFIYQKFTNWLVLVMETLCFLLGLLP